MQVRRVGPVVPVVRVSPGGTYDALGTAFAISRNRYATAAHVVQRRDEGLCVAFSADDPNDGYQDTTNTGRHLLEAKLVEVDPVRDIAILEVAGIDYDIRYSIGSSDDVLPGTPIYTVGYPHADYGRLVLTQQSSTVGARILIGSGPIKTKHLVLNIQTRPGQSGSPVFARNNGAEIISAMVIGSYAPNTPRMIIGTIDPDTLHQTTHAISAEYIRRMMA
ncbi:S1 family peptidase [Pseudoroseomonas ludipueritiae]|uniref:Trypsin-like peptidase domain-containing protein n=1 Tax=Pseudoroseomonas ludipueritiae TaxID=198093 RepID=A0ABR7R821_9PROT|nr:trypsin-like peptidase domain-containing protein [Pseudoroseomonas ludipueritiae]